MPAEEVAKVLRDNDQKKEKKQIVLVGIRIDSKSRELLDWALVKVAQPGDCVVAIHVCRNSDHLSKNKTLLDDYLQVYEGLCSANKVELAGQVLRGSSVRRILVREAKSSGAAVVVVGIRNQSTLRSLASVAKHCAKQLPATAEVLAVHCGKVVFRRSNSNLPQGLRMDPRPSFELSDKLSEKGSQSEFGDCETSSDISKDETSSCVHGRRRASDRSISLQSRVVLDQRPGWPLLRRAFSEIGNSSQARNTSVVHWVMNLPERFPQQNLNPLLEGRQTFSSSAISELRRPMEAQMDINLSGSKWFSYEVLRTATSDFSSENLIGKGGCNRVYKGILPDQKQVAVKIWKSTKEEWKDFANEVSIIASLKHKNVWPLLGICIEDNDLISVYELSSVGSLEENLHGKQKDKNVLSWEVRFEIALGIAEALDYLHNECSRPVIHRDVKSSNVLLSDQFEPQLSDFGLAIWGPTSSSFLIQHDLVGTFGYLAPEYFMYGKVGDKIDVYAFGVVLLELLSGRKPISSETLKGQESLVMWAKPLIESGDSKRILDPNLPGDLDEAQLRRTVHAASLCLTQAARLRPNIREVLRLLKGDDDIHKRLVSHENEDQGTHDCDDDEVYPNLTAELRLSLALLGAEDDSASQSSLEQSTSVFSEEFLKEGWSQSSGSD